MPRSKAPPPDAGTPVVTPVPRDRVFSPRKGKDKPAMTHERIAADIDAFRKAGGEIERLGTTRSLRRIDPDDGTPPPAPPARRKG
jgi:hypothetical protein